MGYFVAQFLIILLNFILYLCLYTWVYIPQLHFINMEPTASQVRNYNSLKNQEVHYKWALAPALKKTANDHSQSNVSTPTQLPCIQLVIANVRGMIHMKNDDDDTDREIRDDASEDTRESTLWFNIVEDHFDSKQEFLPVDQVPSTQTVWTRRVPLPIKSSRANSLIGCTLLPNRQHPAAAILPPFHKC